MKKILAIVLSIAMLLPVIAVNTFADDPVSSSDEEIVVFNNPDGEAFSDLVNPWDFFGVGGYWGREAANVLNITIGEVKEIAEKGGAKFTYVFSGDYFGVPSLVFEFSDPQAKADFTVTELGDGKYEATASFDDLVTAWEANGKSINDIANLLVQPNYSNFKLYSAKIVTGAMCEINGTKYDTLEAAVRAAEASEIPVTITMLRDGEGNGITVASGSEFTVDFNGFTYTVVANPAGSEGTKSQSFQLLKDSTITFKNGTLTATADSGVKMIIQNYCDLTLTDMNLIGTENVSYVMSNNHGNVLINGDTNITATDGNVAFDVCYANGSYTDGVSVTVDTTGTITGKVEFSTWNAAGNGNPAPTFEDFVGGANLTVNNGTINGELSFDYVEDLFTYEGTPRKEINILTESNAAYIYGNSEGITWNGDGSVTIDGNNGIGLMIPDEVSVNVGDTVELQVEATTGSDTFRSYLTGADDAADCDIAYWTISDGKVSQTITMTVTSATPDRIHIKGQAGGTLTDTTITKAVILTGMTEEEIAAAKEEAFYAALTQDSTITFNGGTFTDKDTALQLVGENHTVDNDGNIVAVPSQPVAVTNAGVTRFYDTIEEAIDNVSVNGTITLYNNVEAKKQVELGVDGVTLNLNGFTLTSAADFYSSYNNDSHLVNVTGDNVRITGGTLKTTAANKHALNIYYADGVVLEGLTVDHSVSNSNSGYTGAPIIVNASEVTVKGRLNIITGAVSWYGANVDSRNDKSASLTFAQGTVVTFDGPSQYGIVLGNTGSAGSQTSVVEFEKNVSIIPPDGVDFTAVVAIADGTEVVNPGNAGLNESENGQYVVVPVQEDNKISGCIYLNNDYHALIVNGRFIVYPHTDNGTGFCAACKGVIESSVEIEDPIEPSLG